MSRHTRGLGRCFRKQRRAVSEVVGSVLLLLMTVGVFSGIILFVNSIQGPGNQTYVDLVPVIDRIDANNGTLIITHAGGQPLSADSTAIAVQVNGTRYIFTLADGLTPVNNQWVTGQQWMYFFGGNTFSQNATIQVLVVNQADNQLVLLALVQRGIGVGGAFPIIGSTQVIPNGFVYNNGNDSYKVRAIAVDYDNDLPGNAVKVDMTPMGCNVTNQTLRNTGFGIYESTSFSTISSCVKAGFWLLNVTATDLAGHTSRGFLVFEVRVAPGTTPPFIGGGGPFGWLFNNQFQAYEIYNATEWDSGRFNATPTRTFVKGETVVIIVASQFIKNVDLQNDLAVYGSTQLPVVPIVYGGGVWSTTTHPSSRSAFQFEEFIAGYFLYTARFSTDSSAYGFNGSQLDYGRYSLEMTMRANNVDPPLNRFSTADAINVTDAAGGMPNFPRFEFFKDGALTQPSNFYSFTETVYVRITVRDTDAAATFGVVTIGDYIGGIQVRAPPGNTPVTTATVKNSTVYTFSVDLSNPNGDAWVYGQNAYGIKLTQLIDDNEKYSLTSQLIITGPKWALDVVSAIKEWGHPVFGTKVYSLFYQNDANWNAYYMEAWDSSPAQQNPDFGGAAFLDIRLGDLDADNDLDAVIGTESGYVFAYNNVNGDGHLWERSKVDYLGKKVLSVEVGHIDADAFNDLVAGTEDGQIWYYRNDGSWISLQCTKKHPNKDCPITPGGSSPVLLASIPGKKVQDLKMADVNGDGTNDVVAGLENNLIRVFLNDGFGSFGLFTTTDYTTVADSTVQGTLTNTYTATQTSNNDYEQIQEVNGTGQTLTTYQAVGEFMSAFGQIESGSYANTFSQDGAPFEVLSETFTSSGNHWLIANSSAGGNPGHQWAFGTIPALGASDSASVTIGGFLSAGTEPMEIRFKVGGGAASAALGQFTETTMATKTFPLTGFAGGGDLYIILQDTDRSDTDQNSDGKQTKFSADSVQVTVSRANGTTSRLEQKWQTATIITGGSAYRLFMEANHTANTEQDDFLIQWAPTSTGPWSDVITITGTIDDDTTQNGILPSAVAGTQIWVRATDTNRTSGANALDTLYVDNLFVRRYVSTPNTQNISTASAALEIVIADMDRDGHNDIISVIGKGATIYYGPNWARDTRLDTPQDAFSLDVGHIDQNGQLDVVVGSNEQNVYVFYQSNSTYTRTNLVDLSVIKNTQATYIRVGDIDGDGFDDVIIGTKDGDILWYRHLHGTGWDFTQVEQLSKPLFSLDIGDVDRGITFEYSGRIV